MANYREQLQNIWQPLQEKLKAYQTQFKQSALWQSSIQRWQHLSKREQYLLAGATTVIGLTFIYKIIISPLNTAIADYRQGVIKDQELLVFMQAAAPRIMAERGEVKPTQTITTNELLPTIENSLKEEGLLDKNLSELNLVDGNGVHMQFAQVDFNLLLLWLVGLREKYGISVDTFNATPTDQPGIVNVDLQIILNQ
jgi:type II secretory pathway component PulM